MTDPTAAAPTGGFRTLKGMHDVLPPEVFPAMVPEVVGNLAQARFEAWDRALEADNAA